MQDVARNLLPSGMAYEWSGLAFQEIEAGSRAGFVFALSALFVFLVLAAQYESWLVPLAGILAGPLGGPRGATAPLLRGAADGVYAPNRLPRPLRAAGQDALLNPE